LIVSILQQSNCEDFTNDRLLPYEFVSCEVTTYTHASISHHVTALGAMK